MKAAPFLRAAVLAAFLPGSAAAAPAHVDTTRVLPAFSGPAAAPAAHAPDPRVAPVAGGLERAFLRNVMIRAPQDTIGWGAFREAGRLFVAGLFDSAAADFQRFAMRFPRNLLVNDAIERVLLIRENREPRDEALRLYARTLSLRESGAADSAAATAREGLERFPNARIRYHWEYLLAEIAHERGDHPTVLRYALLVGDSTSTSRLAPYALKLAGDEIVLMGDDPQKALRLYQALLERYPTSPLAPPVRAQVLEIRKRLQL